MSDKKKYCYKSSCEFVQTGFHLEQYFVCRECKEEVSDTLRERKTEEKEAERKRLEREAAKREEEEDPYKVWHYL
jgi:ATP-dependent protease Clp ATPase subunit